MAHNARKPSGREIKKYVPFLLCLVGSCFTLLSYLPVYASHQLSLENDAALYSFTLIVSHFLCWTGISLMILGIVIFMISKLLNSRHPENILYHHRLDKFFYTVGVSRPLDDNLMQYPDVQKTKTGFRIEAISDTQDKLLDLNDALSNYLARHKSHLRISESYVRDGWVYYVLAEDFRHDQLED